MTKNKLPQHSLLPQEIIERKIFILRGKKVMLDKDLAVLYGVSTRVLNQAVKRNAWRFPEDFMFRLTKAEHEILRSQFVTSSWGGRRYLPLVFTEPGVAMLSSVLNSEIAIKVNIQIIRTFIKLREAVLIHRDLEDKLKELERKSERHDTDIQGIFEAIRQLMTPPDPPKRKIGFHNK